MFAALILPVSLNGIGVREAVFVYFLRDSTTPAQAIALGVAFFAVGAATALVGALILLVRFAPLRHAGGAAAHADRGVKAGAAAADDRGALSIPRAREARCPTQPKS